MLRQLEAFERKWVCLGDTVDIKCSISFHHDITWLKLNNEQPPIVMMVTSLISDGEMAVIYRDKDLWTEASVKGRAVTLTIKNISVDYLGLYYCTRTKDKVLTFVTGVLVHGKNAFYNSS